VPKLTAAAEVATSVTMPSVSIEADTPATVKVKPAPSVTKLG